jgi:pimeloyl-ACP methyl ester carboxylesterase
MTTAQSLLSSRWRVRAAPFETTTADGVRIAGARLGDPSRQVPAVVLAHGYLGWHRKPGWARFAEALTRWFDVHAFDQRGHGASGGTTDFGGAEIEDVDAVVARARALGSERVVTVGASMGGISVIRHAGVVGGVDAVVAISSLATWDWQEGADPRSFRRLQSTWATPIGRRLTGLWGVRFGPSWEPPSESPEDVVGKIAPVPVAIVHGLNDHLFSLDHAWRLYEAAGEPKRLLLGDRFGHAEDGLTQAFAVRLARVTHEMLELPWSG